MSTSNNNNASPNMRFKVVSQKGISRSGYVRVRTDLIEQIFKDTTFERPVNDIFKIKLGHVIVHGRIFDLTPSTCKHGNLLMSKEDIDQFGIPSVVEVIPFDVASVKTIKSIVLYGNAMYANGQIMKMHHAVNALSLHNSLTNLRQPIKFQNNVHLNIKSVTFEDDTTINTADLTTDMFGKIPLLRCKYSDESTPEEIHTARMNHDVHYQTEQLIQKVHETVDKLEAKLANLDLQLQLNELTEAKHKRLTDNINAKYGVFIHDVRSTVDLSHKLTPAREIAIINLDIARLQDKIDIKTTRITRLTEMIANNEPYDLSSVNIHGIADEDPNPIASLMTRQLTELRSMPSSECLQQ